MLVCIFISISTTKNSQQLSETTARKNDSLIFKWISKELFVLLYLIWCVVGFFLLLLLLLSNNEKRRKEQNEEAERTTCISCLTLELIGSCNSLKLRMSAHGISLKSLSYIVNRTTCICIDCLVSPKGKWKHMKQLIV